MEFMVNQASGTDRGDRQGKGAYLSGVMVGDLTDQVLTERLAKPRRIVRLCYRRGLLNDSQIDPLAEESPYSPASPPLPFATPWPLASGPVFAAGFSPSRQKEPQTRYSNCS